jgi:hypothetical protein
MYGNTVHNSIKVLIIQLSSPVTGADPGSTMFALAPARVDTQWLLAADHPNVQYAVGLYIAASYWMKNNSA